MQLHKVSGLLSFCPAAAVGAWEKRMIAECLLCILKIGNETCYFLYAIAYEPFFAVYCPEKLELSKRNLAYLSLFITRTLSTIIYFIIIA